MELLFGGTRYTFLYFLGMNYDQQLQGELALQQVLAIARSIKFYGIQNANHQI